MAVQTSYPGVYIDEFAPGAPIQGVGTAVAAFVGVAERGIINEPRQVTSWDQFRARFGDQPLPGHFLWYAVRGFFENGGQVCYVVRASNGDYASAVLVNDGGNDTILARARTPGELTGTRRIEVEVQSDRLLQAGPTGLGLFRPTAGIASLTAGNPQELTLAATGSAFRPGDRVTFGTTNPVATILRVTGTPADPVVLLDAPIGASAGNTLRLANLTPGSRTFRVAMGGAMPTMQSLDGATVAALGPGTVLTLAPGTAAAQTGVVQTVQTEHLPDGSTSWRVTLREGLASAVSLGSAVEVRSEEIRLRVQRGTQVNYVQLGVDPAHPRYFLDVVNADPAGLVVLEPVRPAPPDALPDSILDLQTVLVAGGAEQDLAAMAAAHYRDALDALARIDDVNMIAVPDATRLDAAGSAGVQQAIINHCELLADRFGVLDARGGLDLSGADSIVTQRQGLDSTRGYAGLYYPWLEVPSAYPGPAVLVPPSGHVCGLMARVDLTRGVHKAPANEIVRGTQGVERPMSDVEQGLLNLRGINVIRQFTDGSRPILWGARTTATDNNWLHVSTRRLFLFLEESIEEGIRWAVFEPNNLSLWQKLRRTITDFLRTQYRAGALFGESEEDAFYVRIDEDLNPFSEQQLGRLHLEIGVRPAYPAEFIVVRIGIWDGGSEVAEG